MVLNDGEDLGSAGDVVCRPDLARTLRHIADEGVDSFYRGDIAARMVAHLRSLGGYIRRSDLASVRVPESPALRSRYRSAEILAFPFPGAGPEVIETLNILQTFPTEVLADHTVKRLHLLVEAYRIAQIDHQQFAYRPVQEVMGTPGYLGEAHARARAALINPGRAILETDLEVKTSVSILGEHTTQVSVADTLGNAVSLTQTLCRQYGVKVATPGLGFPYNSCLEFLDFENPESPLFLSARRRYPSGMAPTIFRHNGRLVILGSAGSDRIAPSVTEVISNIIDRNMDLKAAVVAPRILWNSAHDPPRVCLEIAGPVTTNDADRLQGFGFDVLLDAILGEAGLERAHVEVSGDLARARPLLQGLLGLAPREQIAGVLHAQADAQPESDGTRITAEVKLEQFRLTDETGRVTLDEPLIHL